ncbi:MAG: hypothetical protein ACJ73D_01645 [Pyrinomonadaceae bacterium]
MNDDVPHLVDPQLEAIVKQIGLAAASERSKPSVTKDGLAAAERAQLEIERLRIEVSDLQAKVDRDSALHSLRTEYVPKLYRIIKYWIILVAIVVVVSCTSLPFFNNPACPSCISFRLSENVLIAFITSTTATVVGLFYLVAKWLYPADKPVDK